MSTSKYFLFLRTPDDLLTSLDDRVCWNTEKGTYISINPDGQVVMGRGKTSEAFKENFIIFLQNLKPRPVYACPDTPDMPDFLLSLGFVQDEDPRQYVLK